MKPHVFRLKNSVEVSILMNKLHFVSLVACTTGRESRAEIQLLEPGPASLPVLLCDDLGHLPGAAPAWGCFREYTKQVPPQACPVPSSLCLNHLFLKTVYSIFSSLPVS